MSDATIISGDLEDGCPVVSEPMPDPDTSLPLRRTLAVSSSPLLSSPSSSTWERRYQPSESAHASLSGETSTQGQGAKSSPIWSTEQTSSRGPSQRSQDMSTDPSAATCLPSSLESRSEWPKPGDDSSPFNSQWLPSKEKEEATTATTTGTTAKSFPHSTTTSEGTPTTEGTNTPKTLEALRKKGSVMPWYQGPQHCVNWPARSPNSGFLSLASGLGTQSLREPGTAGYADPAIAPKNEAEWEALFTRSFDDLAPSVAATIKGQAPNTANRITWQQRFRERVELEKRIFGNKDVYSFMKVAPAFLADTRFQCRWVGPLFAVATAITCNDTNDVIYEAIAKESKARELQTFSNELKLRVAEAKTVTKGEELLGAIVKALESFEETKDKDAIEDTKLLKALCEARLSVLKENEGAGAVGEDSLTDEDDPAAIVEADDLAVPSGEEGSKKMRQQAAPVVPKEVPLTPEFDPTQMSQEALKDKLAKLPRPVHVLSTLTVALGEDGIFPFELIADPKTAPPAHTVFAHQTDYKGRGPFEQITDKTMHGTLWTCSMYPTSQSSCKWRPMPKTKIQIPCAFAGHEQELLVVDHDKAYIIVMPKGKATKDVYPLRRDPTHKTQFKISHCSLTAEHVMLVGFQPNNTRPIALLYNRRKRLCTAMQTSIPITSATLSQHEKSTVLFGMKDGTVLRVAIPCAPSKKHKPVFALYHPVVSAPNPEALQRLRKARGDYRIDDTTVIPQDWILHVGAPLPVTHLVERRQRLIASTTTGLHLFKLYLPDTDEDRRITMTLRNVVSYDWRGNVLVTLSQDNSLRMLQLHECRLEATIGAPVGLNPKPPECTIDCKAISLSDQAIVIVHMDGSRRVLELKDSAQVVAASTSNDANDFRTEEEKARSFLPEEVAATAAAAAAGKKPAPAVVGGAAQKKRFVRTVKK